MATANDYCLFAFCASLPTKREAKCPLFFYFLTGALSLLTGQRNNFLLTLSFIVMYYCLRNQGNGEKWIGKREIFFVCMAVPVIIIFIVWFGYAREKNSLEAGGLPEILYILFDQQGVSATVIAYQQQFHSNPILNQNFTFGPLWSFLTQNQLTQLFGAEAYHQNTAAAALHGHSLGQSISYLVLGHSFLEGKGLGSSYIAETMQDYSFLGVVLVNFIYGKFMHITKGFENKGFWMRLYVCFAIKGIIYAPRDTAIGPFLSFFTFSSLATLLTIWVGMMVIQQITGSAKVKKEARDEGIFANGSQKKSCYIK
jgi:oligosaccharide repeat unit polymerase